MARVVVVDDEKSLRITLREFLRKAGHDVEVASDSAGAERYLMDGNVDVLVTDIVMPGTTGVELLRHIREISPDVQVIVMTGQPTVDTAAEALRQGAIDYLVKPVSKAAIVRSVGHAARIKELDDERRRLEAENQRYRMKLEQRVAERTHELHDSNRNLSSALEQVKRAQQQMIQQERLNALGQMVSGIAHDFNNILMPILGLSDLLLADPDSLDNREEARETLTTIRDAAEDARALIRRLREFYKPDEALERQPVDVRALIEGAIVRTEAAWKIQAAARGRTIRVAKKMDDLPPLAANESQLRDVLTNLILNATDAMPAGGTITIAAFVDEPWSLNLVSRCLKRDGHTVTTAGDGQMGLRIFRGDSFDLVVTDRAMPDMTGDELVARLKADAPNLPIVMLTGFGDLMAFKSERVPGVDVLLSKPTTRRELRDAVTKAIGLHAAATGKAKLKKADDPEDAGNDYGRDE